jgi:hypothetical protein
MPEEIFETNIMRFIAAQLYFSVTMQAAREMYGKSYFSLGVVEKADLDQLVFGAIAANYQAVTPEKLRTQTVQQPAGFQVPTGKTGQS